jgi:hypothetical protein
METIFILAATIVVFSLFLVVYFFKDRSDDDNSKKPACARCDCHRGQQQDDPPLRHPKQIEKEGLPCSTGRSLKWSASD